MKPAMISGWQDPKTGESGKFDKDNNPVPLTLDDKIKNWFKRLFHVSTYVYAGTITRDKDPVGVYYLNHEKKRGYMIYMGSKEKIDYYAVFKDKSIVRIN